MCDRNAHVISKPRRRQGFEITGVTYVAFVLDEVISKSRRRQGFEITVISSRAEGKLKFVVYKATWGRAEGKSVAKKAVHSAVMNVTRLILLTDDVTGCECVGVSFADTSSHTRRIVRHDDTTSGRYYNYSILFYFISIIIVFVIQSISILPVFMWSI